MNPVPGSLPIEVEQGRRTISRVVTQFLATAQLTLDVGVDDIDLRQLSAKLASIYGTPVDVQVLSGSAVVLVSGVLNATSLSTFAQASQIGDDVLSRMLGVPTTAVPFAVRAVNVSVPFDEPCTCPRVESNWSPARSLPSTPHAPPIPIAPAEYFFRSLMLRQSWFLL